MPAAGVCPDSAAHDGRGCADGTGHDGAKAPESPWAKAPPPTAQEQEGWFLIPPSGAGYYSALDWFRGETRDKEAPSPYRPGPSSFDLDFSYLDKPGGQPVDCFDRLKRMPLWPSCSPWGHNLELSVGGEEREEFRNEIGGTNGRLNGIDDTVDRVRTRVWGDLWFRDDLRVFAEYLDAQAFYSNGVAPLNSDVTHSQFLNLFVDVKLGTLLDAPVYGRVGRQEMNYGSQRLLASPDWSNIRRSYDGAKVFWHTDKVAIDGFWLRPVNNLVDRFNAPDSNRQLAGLWAAYRPSKEQTFDAYYLYFDEKLPVRFGAAPGGRGGFDNNTFGGRWDGRRPLADLLKGLEGSPLAGNLMWDFEGAYQFGNWSGRPIRAGMTATGLGYAFVEMPLEPQFWAYFEYASGTPRRNDPNSTFETFDQLFPSGHHYFGYLDEVGRENIRDLNFQASIYPAKWITSWMQYHIFRLDQAGDALYGDVPGFPTVRFDPTGRAGTNVGQELDCVAEFRLGRHSTFLLGYSKLFSGDFVARTGPRTNPEMFYTQYYFRW